jgi:hypothetical protein
MSDEETIELFRAYGYIDVKKRGGEFFAISRFIYTYGVLINITEYGYSGRFCFDNLQNAQLFYNDWDFESQPVVGLDGCTAIK